MWRIHPLGIGANVLLSALLGILCFALWRWLVRNSAIRGQCDHCGYRFAGTQYLGECPECGEGASPFDPRLTISQRSSWMLFTVLTIAGIGALGHLATEVAMAAGKFRIAANPVNPWPWQPWVREARRVSSAIFILAEILFGVWLYQHPAKRRLYSVRLRQGLCPVCAYPIGIADRCSECGSAIPHRHIKEHAE